MFRSPGIAPNITAGPADSAVIDGTSVILHCETSGAPRPAITWQKGAWASGTPLITPRLDSSTSGSNCGKYLLPSTVCFPDTSLPSRPASPPPPVCLYVAGERVLASGSVQLPRFTLLESGSLLISPSHLSDAGTYTCMASNSRGIDEASADLLVWGNDAITHVCTRSQSCL